tara:strand:- start:7344 stop:7487 length:144 start_codon:yes stop_codon:yes gene_type:complete
VIAKQNFIGIINGKEKDFKEGQKISQKDAKELNLAEKPELAKAEKGE